ncbi:Multidrug resistance-associated protein 4 [Clydaea vesicula]|uniref:Multidrug resistance-associated protein 4 n=1 Tax=Clydaea vesicula TaxID=447962 RepID=A0AAD5TYP7_9FUNG|nr:Multidrug resistance-associated protein 4 [Clydaea vesicula]
MSSLAQHTCMFFGLRMGIRLRVGFCSLVYQKMLRLSARFEDAAVFLPYLFTVPIEIIASLIFVYSLIGFASFFVLFGLIFFMILQSIFGKKFGKLRGKTVKFRDERVRTTSDMFAGILVVKLYAWEKAFAAQVEKERVDELKNIKKSSIIKAINDSLFFTATALIAAFPLLAFYFMGGVFNASIVFGTITIIANLRLTLTKFFAMAIQLGSEALISAARLQEFLLLGEISLKKHSLPSGVQADKSDEFVNSDVVMYMKNASFDWSDPDNNEQLSDSKLILSGINLQIRKGISLGVCGPVGCGKSALASAIMGEMNLVSGSFGIREAILADGSKPTPLKIAYCSQIPWIISGTIKENILFSSEFNQEWFDTVINACELRSDIEAFPNGINTLIGERGVMLSGGQKARLAIARAVYYDADLYNDPLSAVDAKVGRGLFENLIKNLLLSSKSYGEYRKFPAAVILFSHQLQFIKSCNEVLVLINGKINNFGTFNEAIKNNTQNVEFINAMEKFFYSEEVESEVTQVLELNGTNSLQIPSANDVEKGFSDFEKGDIKTELKMEEKAVGSVPTKTYLNYFSNGVSYTQAVILLVVLLIGQISAMLIDYWLSLWADSSIPDQKRQGVLNASVYSALVVFTLTELFLKMLNSVIRSPLNFFEVHPLGRILNRFSKDLSTADEMLPTTFFDFVQCVFQILGAIAICLIYLPYVVILLPFCGYFFFLIRKYYVSSSRQIKRLDSITRSPVYSQIPVTLEGLPTLRAFGAEDRSLANFNSLQNQNTRIFFAFIAAGRWLGIRLDMIVSIFLLAVMALCIILMQLSGLEAASIGLVITYTLQMLGYLQWYVTCLFIYVFNQRLICRATRQSAEVENQMVCVERILEYTNLIPEATDVTNDALPDDWPSKGEVNFNSLSLIYPGSTKEVLSNISVKFEAGQKIGIVGRTGSGKSSLLQALFRLVEPSNGNVVIDGINTLHISLMDLRSRISIIPQEPFCFKGTLRFNIDPFQHYSGEELWKVLEAVELKKLVESMPLKLESPVSEGGGNWSVGERQLMCLARAILRNTRLIVMDEATSSIVRNNRYCKMITKQILIKDLNTDSLVQNAIRSKTGLFADSTVVTIAHRLNTVIDFDKIMVLNNGRVVEFGSPYQMLMKESCTEDAYFKRMVDELGVEAKISLLKIAKEKEFNKN